MLQIELRSKSDQLKKPKFVDPESAVGVDVGVGVGVDVVLSRGGGRADVEGTIEIGVGVRGIC